ncbi:MAG: sulfatase [Verrucomicrobia bacterium]|nr:sulfatase [Verrucomicrobiota bacterium]
MNALALPLGSTRLRLLAVIAGAFAFVSACGAVERPNLLWFIVDDMSPNFSCYGETLVETPQVDRLAKEGTRFSRAYVTAPVCSPCRSALITGMYQTTIGAHHHRSGRGELKIRLPEGVEPIPAILQRAGYFTCIGSGLPAGSGAGKGGKGGKGKGTGLGKTDYNFETNPAIYDGPDWAGRAADQPFFMQVQLSGGKLREGPMEERETKFRATVRATFGGTTDPEKVVLPPHYPRDPVLLRDWADYLDAVRLTDAHVGKVIARLEQEGTLDETLVVFMTDHGISHARGKQFLYDEGTHVPLVVRGPGIAKGVVRDDLVEHIDLAALTLAAAGLPLPARMQGRDLFAKDYVPRSEAFAARDRCDETVDKIRSLRTDRFLYVRNYHPQRPHLQPNRYKDAKPILAALRAAHDAGTLPPSTEELLFAPTRPAEELYDYRADSWQNHNLAADPAHAETLAELRGRLDAFLEKTGDPAPESEAMYDSDMAEYLKRRDPVVEANIAQMKRWAAEGK